MCITTGPKFGQHRIGATNLPKLPKTPNEIGVQNNNNEIKTEKKEPLKNTVQPTQQSTNKVGLETISEMKNDIDESIQISKNTTSQELNKRGSKVFSISDVNKKDELLLKQTKDDAKPIQHDISDNIIETTLHNDIGKMVKDLDSTILKKKVYQQAENFGKNFIEKLDPQSKLSIELTSKSPEEVKDIISKTVFGLKEKYSPKYEQAVKENDILNSKIKEISNIKNKFDDLKFETRSIEDKIKELSTKPKESEQSESESNEVSSSSNNVVNNKEDIESLRKELESNNKKIGSLREEFFNKSHELTPQLTKIFEENGDKNNLNSLPDIRDYTNVSPVKMYDHLPENKQILVNKIFEGIQSANPQNKINNLLDQTTLEPKQLEKLNEFFSKAPVSSPKIDIPSSIEFKGKTYNFDRFLGGGGDGIAFSMKSNDGEKVVVKSPIFDEYLKSIEKEANTIMKREALTHVTAMDDGHKNILEMKGVVKGPNTLMTVTEFAKGGELNDVVDKVKNSGISDENKNLLKLVMTKDAIQGLQFMQTEKNMSHYDVKPKNFFVGEGGVTKLSDFGRAGFGHKVEVGQMTAAYTPKDALPRSGEYKPSEKIDTYAMGISLDQILNDVNYDDDNVKYVRKDDTSLNKLISSMTSDKPEDRPTLTSVLKHSVFDNPVLNDDKVQDKAHQLINAIIDNKQQDITRLNQELEEAMKNVK